VCVSPAVCQPAGTVASDFFFAHTRSPVAGATLSLFGCVDGAGLLGSTNGTGRVGFYKFSPPQPQAGGQRCAAASARECVTQCVRCPCACGACTALPACTHRFRPPPAPYQNTQARALTHTHTHTHAHAMHARHPRTVQTRTAHDAGTFSTASAAARSTAAGAWRCLACPPPRPSTAPRCVCVHPARGAAWQSVWWAMWRVVTQTGAASCPASARTRQRARWLRR
jgi:hypothetical protein